jgi:hypothetical protein
MLLLHSKVVVGSSAKSKTPDLVTPSFKSSAFLAVFEYLLFSGNPTYKLRSIGPKARGLAQHGDPPGWLEESDPAGYSFVLDGRSMPPSLP